MKRVVSLLLAIAMVLGYLPANFTHVHATEIPEKSGYTVATHTAVSPAEPVDSDMLYAAYSRQIFYDDSIAPLGTEAGKRLTGDAKLLYDALVPMIRQIAAGQRASAVIGIGSTVSYNGTTYAADVEATFSSASLADGTTQVLLDALLSDLPYEMYWFDKTADHAFSIQTLSSSTQILHIQVRFTVADNYKGSDDHTTDTARTGAAANAAANAQSIVAAYAGKSDYEKLLGYKTEICDLVSYDHDAADTGSFSLDNDPWQLIHVFDGDSNTNVVCEGYSKAFMYLCDLTDFTGDVICYTVTGNAGGPHMWNIVSIGEQNYLVDVTNSDSGTIGQDGSLFLAGTAGSAEAGYTFDGLTYTYDSDTTTQWGTDADSILTLAETGYVPGQDTEEPVASGKWGENLTWALTSDGTLTISGQGEGAMGSYDDALEAIAYPWTSYKTQVIKIVIEEGVTSLPNAVFADFANVTQVDLPGTLAEIESHAFTGTGIIRLVLPEGLSYLGSGCFYECRKLEAVQLPSTITFISDYTFDSCTSLTTVVMPQMPELEYINEGAFYGCTALTDISWYSADILYGDLFTACTGLVDVTVPEGVTEIWSRVFSECSNLKRVTFPKTLKELGYRIFTCENGLALDAVVFQGEAPAFDEEAFYDVTATCYYPADDSTWTADVMQNYGGTITWVPYAFTIASGTCGDSLTWELTSDGTLTISGTGHMYGEESVSDCAAWYDYREQILSVEIREGVTSIGHHAFCECTALTSVTIPASVTSIGQGAFYQCTSLTQLELPAGLTEIPRNALSMCESLTELEIPESVESIGIGAFWGCVSLAQLELPEGLKEIGSSAFGNCDSLTHMTIPEGITEIPWQLFVGCYRLESVTFPSTVTKIDQGTFLSCPALKEFVIPEGVTAIPAQMFMNCYTLTSVTIPDSVTQIRAEAFKDTGKLTSLILPAGLTSIGDQAFVNCGVTELVIPAGVSAIGSKVFYSSALQRITFLGNAPTISSDAFLNMEVDAYYPAGNESWTEAVLQNYGGTLTWESLCSGHQYASVVTAPTCTEGGYTTHTCTICGHSYVDAHVDAPGHSAGEAIVENNIAPTCETGGCYDSVVYCARCGEELSRETVTVPASGHSYAAVVTEPTCTEGGYTTHTCTVCGHSYVDAHVDALGHDLGEWIATEDPTCTEPGSKVRTCSRCDYQETDTIRPSGHSYNTTVTEPTCTEDGYTTHVCDYCGDSYVDDHVDALGHDLGQWMPDGTGFERRDCSRCDYSESREIEVIRPDAPVLTLTNVASSGKIKLTWNSVENAASYQVYRSTDGENWSLLKTLSGTSLTNTSAVAGNLYHYYVIAVDAAGNASDPSAIVSRRCDLPRPVITLSNVASSGKIKISWEKIDGAVKYEVYRSTDNKTWTLLKTVSGTSLTNTSTTAGSLYYYKVKAIASDTDASSAFSAVKSRYCDLARPTVTLSNVASSGKIKISWEKIDGAVKYEVYRSTDNKTWTLLKTVSGTSLTNTSTTAGTLYYYKVKAIASGAGANSADSAVKSRTCDLARPSLTVTLNSKGKPVITWKKVTGAVKYTLYIYNAEGRLLKTSTTTGTKITHSSAVRGTTYKYRVVAVHSNSSANSAKSSTVSITAK